MRKGQLAPLFFAAASALAVSGCAHMDGPQPDSLIPPAPLNGQEQKMAEAPAPLPPLKIALKAKAAPAALPAAIDIPLPRPSPLPKRKPEIRISFGNIVTPLYGAVDFCKRHTQECLPGFNRGVIADTGENLAALNAVNLEVNGRIAPANDIDQYGQEELWTYPDSGKGDCEDYALEKRRQLLAKGFPASALLLAVVNDANNTGHAVLVARTEKHDYVLNNLTDKIVTWTNTDFQSWRMIQTPGYAGEWRAIGKWEQQPGARLPVAEIYPPQPDKFAPTALPGL
jgi:predicted transglutaminase-like cysteine proteinase